MRIDKKIDLEKRRRRRLRKTIKGTADRPRMSVRFTNKNIHVQFIDDRAGVTLATATTLDKATPERDKLASNVESARKIGGLAASAAKDKGITKVVFDRSGAKFHGKVKALADAAREGGLDF